jgi:hypothetical protein
MAALEPAPCSLWLSRDAIAKAWGQFGNPEGRELAPLETWKTQRNNG